MKAKTRLAKYWQNMIGNKYYIKGERDSQTQYQVLAARKGNYFSPDNCYWDFVKNLPSDTVYVDGE